LAIKVCNFAPLRLGDFYRRRASRIYPLWWGMHILTLIALILLGGSLSLKSPAFYLSMMGIRFTSGLFYYIAPAWWYVGLIIQLYLIYPLLWEGLRRRGPLWLLVVSCAIAFLVRGLGLLFFTDYLDPWHRGAIFITRLPEFVFGISLAAWMHRAPEETEARLRKPATIILALVLYRVGTILSLTLLGMTVAPFFLGVGMFVPLYLLFTWQGLTKLPGLNLGLWVGKHSYSLYLFHHSFILLFLPAGLRMDHLRLVLTGIIMTLFLTVVGAISLEWVVDRVQALLGSWFQQIGLIRTALRLATFGLVSVGLIIGAESMIRWLIP
jgi:peptidoglycan/LPS O-acetylase OafA/YrhL